MFVLLYNFSKILITYCIISCSFLNVAISQDLTRQEPIEKIIYFKGELGQHHYYEPNELTFHTGKLYRLILSNVSDSKHYFSSSLFARAIFTRKIQINYNSNCHISMYAIYDAQLTKLEIAEQWDEWYGTNQNKDMMHEE